MQIDHTSPALRSIRWMFLPLVLGLSRRKEGKLYLLALAIHSLILPHDFHVLEGRSIVIGYGLILNYHLLRSCVASILPNFSIV